MRLIGQALLALGLLVVAIGIGFLASLAVIITANAVLGPLGAEDDESLREIVPAAIAYLAWAITSGVVFVLSWRQLRLP